MRPLFGDAFFVVRQKIAQLSELFMKKPAPLGGTGFLRLYKIG